MLETLFNSSNLPAEDRVAAWRDITGRALVPNEFTIHDSANFRATLRNGCFGAAAVSTMTYSSMRTRRTAKLIRQSDPDMYALGLVVRGTQGILQGRREALFQTRDLVFYSTFRPYEALVEAQSGTAATVLVHFPRALLPLPTDRVEQLMATRLPRAERVGGLLTGFLTHLAADAGGPGRPNDAVRVGGILIDLVSVWLAHHLDADDQSLPETRQHVRFLEIQDFIRQHLGDPDLTPAAIAAAHHISLRTLHRLFRFHAHGTTCAETIRRQRLAHTHRDLADPRLACRPVHAIAARWGFPRPADFTRAFRVEYGTTPTEHRDAALRANRGT